MDPFKLYVLPVSGGSFPIQLSFVTELYKARKINNPMLQGEKDYHPDLVMAASGGNVASYVSMAGDWNYHGIMRMVEFINKDLFLKSWIMPEFNFLPSWLIGLFLGSFYRSGDGTTEILKTMFTDLSIQKTEILTLTYNTSDYYPQIFSNRKSEDSFIDIKPDEKDIILYEYKPVIFTRGNISEISKVCMASASIPLLTEPQNINGEEYRDGGIAYGSPFSILKNIIYKKLKDRILQIVIFTPDSMSNKYDDTSLFTDRGMSILEKTMRRLIRSQIQNEYKDSISLLEKILGREAELKRYTNVKTEDLAQVLKEFSEHHYILIMYPIKEVSVKIIDFSSQEIKNIIDENSNAYNFDVYF